MKEKMKKLIWRLKLNHLFRKHGLEFMITKDNDEYFYEGYTAHAAFSELLNEFTRDKVYKQVELF